MPESPPRWGLLHAVGALSGFVALQIATSYGLLWLGIDPTTANIVASPVGWLCLAGWPILVAWRRGNGVRSDLAVACTWGDIPRGSLATAVVALAAFIYMTIYPRLTGDVPSSSVADQAQTATASWQVVSLIVLSLVAPFVEELHFRGMWWSALRRRGLRPWPTLILTSLVFAIAHIELQRVALLFICGLVFGFVRMRTGRLGPAFAAHFIVNAFAAIGLLALL